MVIEIKKNREVGASLVEYALLIALIAIVAIGGMRILGRAVSSRFSSLGSTVATTT